MPPFEDDDGLPPVVPPHDVDAEAAVLSCSLLLAERLDTARAVIEAADFFSEAHRWTFAALVALRDQGRPTDLVSVSTWLRDNGRIEQVGGIPYLTRIMNSAPALSEKQVVEYARTVRRKSRTRLLIATCQRVAAEGYLTHGGHDEELIARAAADVGRIAAEAPAKAAPPPIQFGEQLARTLPPIDWLCAGLKLTSGGVTCLSGPTYAAKSVTAAEISMAVATGDDVFGVFRVRRGRALILNWDGQSERISLDRLQRLARTRGADLAGLGQSIGYWHKPDLHIDDSDARERLLRVLDGVAIVTLDSWRGAVQRIDEWRRDEVQAVGEVLEDVSARTGCVVLLIDHETKPPREGRSSRNPIHAMHGSSAKGELAQAAFTFEGADDDDVRVVRQTKERVTGQKIQAFGLRIEDVAQGGDDRWGLRFVHLEPDQIGGSASATDIAAVKRQILEVVTAESVTSSNAIAARVKGTRAIVLQAIRELCESRKLVQPGGKGTAIHVAR
jgi:DnaB-like helicase N terminal domain/AAA domain